MRSEGAGDAAGAEAAATAGLPRQGACGPGGAVPAGEAPSARTDPALAREEAEAFLLYEARLIDERRFEEWLDLFAADARYCLPGGDGGTGLALIDDDRATLEDRVTRLRSPSTHAQSPPSRTLHVVSGVEVEAGAHPPEVRVHSVCLVYEARLGQVRSLAGRCLHLLRPAGTAQVRGPARASTPGGWSIAAKTVWLVNRDQPLYNLTFLV